MMRKIMALVILLVGIGGGLMLGVIFRPGNVLSGSDVAAAGDGVSIEQGHGDGSSAGVGSGNEPIDQAGADTDNGHDTGPGGDGKAGVDREYIKVGRQIIIPVVSKGETKALMLFDLAIDVPRALAERASAAEPRLRDAFLRVLFEMSYTGAFSSTYTDERVVDELRGKLRSAARRMLGNEVDEVLILDIMRQEL